MWHLRSLAPTTVFDTPNSCANTVMFSEDTVSFFILLLSIFFFGGGGGLCHSNQTFNLNFQEISSSDIL